MKKAILCWLLFFSFNFIQAQSYQLHSVYIYSFIKYIQWPSENADSDFKIGLLGDSPIEEYLNKMAAVKKINNRSIKILKFDDISQVSNIEVLFLSKESHLSQQIVLNKVNGKHVLLITEEAGLGARGSNINFVEKDGRLVFELNRQAMKREGLKVSSELSKLAIEI